MTLRTPERRARQLPVEIWHDVRRSYAGRVLLIGIPLSVLAVGVWAGTGFGNYPLSAASDATVVLTLLAPLVAAVAAAEAHRLGAIRHLARGGVRWPGAPVCRQLWPVICAAMVCFLTACLAVGLSSEIGPYLPPWDIMAVALGVMVLFVAVGALVGMVFTKAVSIPLAALIAFFWATYIAAVSPGWARAVAGDLWECCVISRVLSWQAVTLPLTSGLVAIAVLSLVVGRPVRVRHGAPLALLVAAALTMSVVAAKGTGPDLTRPREPAGLSCAGTTPQVCLWPEHEQARADVIKAHAKVVAAFRQQGIDQLPNVISEHEYDSAEIDFAEQWTIVADPTLDYDTLTVALVAGLRTTLVACDGAGVTDFTVIVLDAWLTAMGNHITGQPIGTVHDPEVAAEVDRVNSMSHADRAAWFAAARGANGHCAA